MLPALIIAGLTFLGAGVAVFFGLRKAQQQGAQFVPVPGVPGARVAAADPARFGTALLAAVDIFVGAKLGTRDDVMRLLATSTNVVSASMSWTDRAGQKVGGSTEFYGIIVASDLSSMFHELVHLVEWRTTGEADGTHSTWAARGVWAADDLFRGWLLKGV